jgi:ribonuclease T2
MTSSPDRYFAQARSLYGRVRFPDMPALARDERLTVRRFEQAILAANPRLSPRSVRVRLTRDGWLDELWLCVDRKLRFAACLANQAGGAAPDRRMRIRPPR